MKIVVFVLLSAHYELTKALYRQHFFINEAKSWGDAQKYCREEYADLSCVYDQQALEALKTVTGAISFGNDSLYMMGWIGLNKISSVDWQWSDGSSSNPALSLPSANETSCCAGFNGFMLKPLSCDEKHPFFCYKWKPELILVKENKTWEDALQHCRTHHTDLASMPTYSHLIQIKQTTANAEKNSVWTGLRFLSGSWFWINGQNLGPTVQLQACPANFFYCGSRNLKTLSWESRDCMEELNFVCY